MSKIRIMLVDDYAETRENIKRLLYFEPDMEVVAEAENGEQAVKKAEKHKPDIILMDINMPVMDGITATELIALSVPQAGVIIMSVQGEQEYLKKAMMAGAREYMVKPFSSDDLTSTIRRVFEFEKKRTVNLVTTETSVKGKREPKIITVFSTKGGVGKTTLGTNLAVSLAKDRGAKVALVDLDLQFGDVSVLLNVVPKRTITELVQEIGNLDSEMLETFLVSHSSGIKILPAPTRPEYAELITGSHIEKILNLLKSNYDYIIVDTPAFFHETNLTAIEMCDQILLIIALELPTIKNVKLAMEVLENLHQKGKIKLILNRSSGDMGIKYPDVERSLGFLVASHIPSEGRIVVNAVNKGVPFVLSDPNSKVAQAIRDLGQLVAEDGGTQEELKQQRKGLISRLFG
ncbi:MAG TPA: response regulator [Bacillota bacterium]|nr:response regulator [Bacillota bacterium]